MRLFAASVILFSVAAAERFTVLVGENGGLTYSPSMFVIGYNPRIFLTSHLS